MNPWRSSMFWRLLLTVGSLLLGSIVVLGAVIANSVERHFLDQFKTSLHTKAILVRELVRDHPRADGDALQERVVALRSEIDTRITLIAVDGRVLADSD